MSRDRLVWPKAPVIYQIYPRSFRDTTGSGWGDLDGICHRLDHVAALGVDAIWLSPFYPSPFKDGGYDIADHIDVDPRFGTLDDFDRLVERAHGLGLKVLIDQVFNHTSTASPWFQRSLLRDPDYDDFYVWRDPKPDGTAPNNWLSQFGPPAWTWNHKRRQYYHHNFTKHQPSLNLRCRGVQDQMRNIMRFWLDRGVDGFRLDAVTSFLMDPEMRNNPPADGDTQDKVSGDIFIPYTYQNHQHDILPGDGVAYMDNLRLWAGEDVFLLGEITSGNHSVELACEMSEPGRLSACYTSDLPESGASAACYADILERACDPRRLGWWLSSHDQPRHATAIGDGSERDTRFLAFLLATAPGPVILYQGEELGLPQPTLPLSAVTDPLDLLYWPDGPGREGPRVPLPWSENGGRGFTTGEPWLPMDWPAGISVAVQEISERSMLGFYRRLMDFRRDSELNAMDLENWSRDGEVIRLRYGRRSGDAACDIVLNFGDEDVKVKKAPDMVSTGFEGTRMPGRCGAAWVRTPRD